MLSNISISIRIATMVVASVSYDFGADRRRRMGERKISKATTNLNQFQAVFDRTTTVERGARKCNIRGTDLLPIGTPGSRSVSRGGADGGSRIGCSGVRCRRRVRLAAKSVIWPMA